MKKLSKSARLARALNSGLFLGALLLPQEIDRAFAANPAIWAFEGGDAQNSRNAMDETLISPRTAPHLREIWKTQLKGSSRATPLVIADTIFVPDSNGHIISLNRSDGSVRWMVALGTILGTPGATAKILALSDGVLVFGLQNEAAVVALDARDGHLLWKTRIEDDKRARVSQPAMIHDGQVFVGTSGLTEIVAASFSNYPCCGFRGSAASLDLKTGRLLWKTYVIPPGFAGASLWSRTPSIDAKRGTVYFTTGNLYRATDSVQTCVDANRGQPDKLKQCFPSDVWFDSIVALNMKNGAIRWGFRATDDDIFTGACMTKAPNTFCGGGSDYDFGNGAIQWRADSRDLVGAGQKSGIFWALDADTGKRVWSTWVGPGGQNGGMHLGSATDGQRIYGAISNAKQLSRDAEAYRLPSGQEIRYGSFFALDPATGSILWQIPDPAGDKYPGNALSCDPRTASENCTGAFPKAPLTVANGVTFGCTTAPDGSLYAFEAATGALLWRHRTDTSCYTGPAVVDGTVYWAVGTAIYAFRSE